MKFSIPPVFVRPGGKAKAWAQGWNARNNFFYIKILRDIEIPAAVLAQERFELAYKWKFGLACSLPVALAIWLLALFPALHIVAVAVFFWSSRLPWFMRRLEYIGHGITALVAINEYDRGADAEFRRNSKSLFDSYAQFKGMSESEVHEAFIDHLGLADNWIRRHGRYIARWKAWFAG